MGLFDKLSKKLENSISTGENSKRYYGIILNLLCNVEVLTKNNIKAYFKAKYNEECDDAALNKALSKFEAEDKRNDTWYSLTFKQFQQEKLDNSFNNKDKDEIIEICFKDFKEEIKIKFKELLNNVSPIVEKRLFDRELDKFKRILNLPDSKRYPLMLVAGKAMGDVIIALLLSKDKDVIFLVSEEICEYMCKYKGLERAYAIAMHAQWFKNNEKCFDKYQSFSQEDCYDVIDASPTFTKEIEKSTYSNETARKMFASQLYNCEIISTTSDFDWKRWAFKDTKFVDMSCYYALSKMADFFVDSDTTSIESSVDIIASYANR